MKVIFRADASTNIGTGHVMRCLTLARALTEQGALCEFICRVHEGNLVDFIRKQCFKVHELPLVTDFCSEVDGTVHAFWLGASQSQDAQDCEPIIRAIQPDWLVIDHYGLDKRWEQSLRPYTIRIMAVDDLADRQHDCDLLLDQNLGRKAQDYEGLNCGQTQMLIGPAYSLLRPEFADWREFSLQRRTKPQLKNLLITMGGVDKLNATGQVLDSLKKCELTPGLRITVVMGSSAPWLKQVQTQAAVMPRQTQVLSGVSNMAQLMAESDLCIGAAGSTSWERCCLGLPAIHLVLAENQKVINSALEVAGAVLTVQLANMHAELVSIFSKVTRSDILLDLSKNAAVVCDGLGTNRTVKWLEKVIN